MSNKRPLKAHLFYWETGLGQDLVTCLEQFPSYLFILNSRFYSSSGPPPYHIPQGFQSFSPTQYQIMFPSLHSPILLLSQVHPSPLVVAFFSLPSRTGTSSLGPFSLLTFLSSVDCILGILYSFFFFFFFLANIHLLVGTYHACPFGSELSHSG